MKNLDTVAMCNAIKDAISFCGIEVLANANRFQAAIKDVMFSRSLNTERELLIFAIRIGIGEELLKAVEKSVNEQERVIIVANALLTVEYGFLQSRSDCILEAFVSALDWHKVIIRKDVQPIPDALNQKPKSSKDKNEHDRQFVKGAVIQFGKYNWRVLYVKGKAALLLADEITDIGIPYNRDFMEVSWGECWVREWLNTEFLTRFSQPQQRRIQKRRIQAEINPWYQTDAGVYTEDKVFLLSITEVVRNFGDSGQLKSRPKNSWADRTSPNGLSCAIDDKYNDVRCAKYKGENTWWWLRSPGESQSKAAYVNADGVVFLNGELVADDGGTSCVGVRPGVRPAIWLQQ